MGKILKCLLASVALVAGSIPAFGDCATSCSHYTTGNQMCVTCCRVCVNAAGEVIYENCDTRCIDY